MTRPRFAPLGPGGDPTTAALDALNLALAQVARCERVLAANGLAEEAERCAHVAELVRAGSWTYRWCDDNATLEELVAAYLERGGPAELGALIAWYHRAAPLPGFQGRAIVGRHLSHPPTTRTGGAA